MKNAIIRSCRANRSLPAVLAVGSSLAALPAGALELGELTVQSRLGQPLRASIAYALAPQEQISNYCITMRPGPSVSGLPGFGAATISVTNGVILLTGSTPVREPMVSAHVIVNCPYSANLSREYMLFIDPLTPAYDQIAVTQQANSVAARTVVTPAAVSPATVSPATVERPVASVQTQAAPADIDTSTRYQVLLGDSLGTIAARIQDRPVGLWAAVDAIFVANPDAFMDNDPNRLKAGSWLDIPDFNGGATVVTAVEPIEPVEPVEPVVEVSSPQTPVVSEAVTGYSAAEATVDDTAAADERFADQEPLAVNLDELAEDSVIVGTQNAPVTIIEAQLEGPATTSSNPNVPTAIISAATTANDGAASPSWLVWLAGSGIAVFLGLVLFGRRSRQGSDEAPDAPLVDQSHRRRINDLETNDTENFEAVSVDYDLSDDSPTEENLALDANLLIGTGLEQGDGHGDSRGFGFGELAGVDIELPFEPVEAVTEQTDMLPPVRPVEHSILDSEVLPDDDDYDMSVIIDATKMPMPEEVTERDLKAVEVADNDDSLIEQSYTISKEVDFKVIEQDYEDEMTATQALNEEIARAAAEIAERMVSDDDKTEALPRATVTELDVTAQMPARNDPISDPSSDPISDPDATGVNESITINTLVDDETAEIPVESEKAG